MDALRLCSNTRFLYICIGEDFITTSSDNIVLNMDFGSLQAYALPGLLFVPKNKIMTKFN